VYWCWNSTLFRRYFPPVRWPRISYALFLTIRTFWSFSIKDQSLLILPFKLTASPILINNTSSHDLACTTQRASHPSIRELARRVTVEPSEHRACAFLLRGPRAGYLHGLQVCCKPHPMGDFRGSFPSRSSCHARGGGGGWMPGMGEGFVRVLEREGGRRWIEVGLYIYYGAV
jgi:hypothetical protein